MLKLPFLLTLTGLAVLFCPHAPAQQTKLPTDDLPRYLQGAGTGHRL